MVLIRIKALGAQLRSGKYLHNTSLGAIRLGCRSHSSQGTLVPCVRVCRDSSSDARGQRTVATSFLSVRSVSYVCDREEDITVPEPPSPLTHDGVVEYLNNLRVLHRMLSVSRLASHVRWEARTFLKQNLPEDVVSFGDGGGCQASGAAGGMTEELATAVVLACGYFEVSPHECPYGAKSVDFLWTLWESRLVSSVSPPCKGSSAVAVGRLTLCLVEMLTSCAVIIPESYLNHLSQMLCKVLLPNVIRLLQEEKLFRESAGSAETDENEVVANAFSTLISALTKAAITGWARRGSSSTDGGNIVLGIPSLHRLTKQQEQEAGAAGTSPFVALAEARSIELQEFSRVVNCYTASLVLSPTKTGALQVLRFFTLNQCVPHLVTVRHTCSDEVRAELVRSLVESVTNILTASLDPNGTKVSYYIANIASSYSRILSYSVVDKAKVPAQGSGVSEAELLGTLPYKLFEDIMIGVQRNIISGSKGLLPVAVLLQLCERITPHTRKYLFSDMAALLKALSITYRVILNQFNDELPTAVQSTVDDVNSRVGMPCQRHMRAPLSTSRFERRRTSNLVLTPQRIKVPNTKNIVEEKAPGERLDPARAPLPLQAPSFIVNCDDVAEIEGELEVLLTSCVAVVEKHLPAVCKSRRVVVNQSRSAPSSASYVGKKEDGSDVECAAKDQEKEHEYGAPVHRVNIAEAKSLGGRGRLLKKSIVGRELVLLAEGVHALSWRPFVAFQERLLMTLSSEFGQVVLSGRYYAHLVRLVLRDPPVLSSVVLHTVGDRLKRLIYSDRIVWPETSAIESDSGREHEKQTVIASALMRPLHDEQLPVHESCAVVFAFVKKMRASALSLLHDLFVRCGKHIMTAVSPQDVHAHKALVSGLMMFVASSTFVITRNAGTASNLATSSNNEDRIVDFIASARDYATNLLHPLVVAGGDGGPDGVTLGLSFDELVHACIMLEACDICSEGIMNDICSLLRGECRRMVSECDSVEIVRLFLSRDGNMQLLTVIGEGCRNGCEETMPLPQWVLQAMRLPERFERESRLLVVMFLPYLKVDSSHDLGFTTNGKKRQNSYSMVDVERVVEITRRHCRTFATLVVVLRSLYATSPSILSEDIVCQMVLRKVTQLIRRTSQSLDIFTFFAMYGDSVAIVTAALRELVPEASCFTGVGNATRSSSERGVRPQSQPSGDRNNAVMPTDFVPLTQVSAALKSVSRLPSRALRQRWLTVTRPLIVAAAIMSREPLEVVLDVAELIKADDPKLLYDFLTHSSVMHSINNTFRFTADSNTLLRLVLLLHGGNISNPTIRQLHIASRKLLMRRGELCVPSLKQVAQAVLLPSTTGTALGRQLRRVFFLRVERLIIAKTRDDKGSLLPECEGVSDGVEAARQPEHEEGGHEYGRWSNELNDLTLNHWLVLLRYSMLGSPSSHRYLMSNDHVTDQETIQCRKTGISPIGDNSGSSTHGETDQHTNSAENEDKENKLSDNGLAAVYPVSRHFRGLSLFYSFSDYSVACLRRALGAFLFLNFVNEVLLHAANAAPHTSPRICEEDASCGGLLMCEDTIVLPRDGRVDKFAHAACNLVEEMCTDLCSFLHLEVAQHGTGRQEHPATDRIVAVDLGAILRHLEIIYSLDSVFLEDHLARFWPPCGTIGQASSDVFSSDAPAGLPMMKFHRILMQLPECLGGSVRSDAERSGDSVSIRLVNVSAVFQYCLPSYDKTLSCDCITSAIGPTENLSVSDDYLMRDIFGDSRPLVSDVWVPLEPLRQNMRTSNGLLKSQIFEAMMQCLFSKDSSAVTRARLASLSPYDLSCVVRACMTHRPLQCGGFNVAFRSTDVMAAVELLTEMLPSTATKDLHDIVLLLTPLLRLPESVVGQGSALEALEQNPSAIDEETRQSKMRSGVQRLLVHVAVVIGNDTERFPLPVLLDIIHRLHTPHRLVSPAAARMMLSHLTSSRGEEPQVVRDEGPGTDEDEKVTVTEGHFMRGESGASTREDAAHRQR
uniref:WGS project CAEQ00000000 data, annotated contig 812 n=1 Tax=Trypanosoma congolense (strain IL3000) TaxID=1068625 RepID=F9WIL7_TRYCI|nr:unnamed protein product [Trypanosoma congolense IL3000]